MSRKGDKIPLGAWAWHALAVPFGFASLLVKEVGPRVEYQLEVIGLKLEHRCAMRINRANGRPTHPFYYP